MKNRMIKGLAAAALAGAAVIGAAGCGDKGAIHTLKEDYQYTL